MTTAITTAQQRMDSYKQSMRDITPQITAALWAPQHVEKFTNAGYITRNAQDPQPAVLPAT